MKPKRLKPDLDYSTDEMLICAYTERGNMGKEQFLRDAAALLRETAKHLAAHGLTQSNVCANRAGVAVSGEVSADYRNPETLRGVWVQIGATCLTQLSGRKDGLSILARWRKYTNQPARRKSRPVPQGNDGPNQWLSPEFNSLELARAILKIYDPDHTPIQVTAHMLGHNHLPIPSPIVSDETQAAVWRTQLQTVRTAFLADQLNRATPTPLMLFDE